MWLILTSQTMSVARPLLGNELKVEAMLPELFEILVCRDEPQLPCNGEGCKVGIHPNFRGRRVECRKFPPPLLYALWFFQNAHERQSQMAGDDLERI